MTLRDQVQDAAVEAARTYLEEFSDSPSMSCDCDAEAWAEVRQRIELTDRQCEIYWPVFQKTLRSTIATG